MADADKFVHGTTDHVLCHDDRSRDGEDGAMLFFAGICLLPLVLLINPTMVSDS